MQKFGSRDDVVIWMIQNQLARRNLPAYERARLALRLKPVVAEKAKENQGTRTDILLNSAKCSHINTIETIAKSAGVGRDTIQKVEKIEAVATQEIKPRGKRLQKRFWMHGERRDHMEKSHALKRRRRTGTRCSITAERTWGE